MPFSLKREKYKQGTRDVAVFIDKGVSDNYLELKEFNNWIHSDQSKTKIKIGKDYDFYYTKKIKIPVNKENVLKYFGQTIIYGVILSILVMLIGLFFAPDIFKLMGSTTNVINLGLK